MPADRLMELVPVPQNGRVFTRPLRSGLADCAPSGRIRLDALARWLQDIAYADVEQAGLSETAAWVVRRTRIRVNRFPRFGEWLTLATFCSGLGRLWAERRTNVSCVDGGGGDVEAVALWVHLDRVTGRPTPLTADEIATYSEAAAGRRVTARLRHPGPGATVDRSRWHFRATECDLLGHINNTAYWQPLEEELLSDGEPESIDVEIEYRVPSQPGDKVILRHGARRWIVDRELETHASIVIAGQAPARSR